MGRYVVDMRDAEAPGHAGIRVENEDSAVRWLHSFLSADRETTYGPYEAPDPQMLVEAATRLDFPADVLVPVSQLGPVPTGCGDLVAAENEREGFHASRHHGSAHR